jgi:iron complex outermembrane receptor protein
VTKSRIEGVDISLAGQGKIGPIGINILAGYTYMNPMNLAPDDTTESGTYKMTSSDTSGILKYRFKHLAKADVELAYDKWSMGVSYRYNSFMVNVDRIFIDLDTLYGWLPTGIAKYREEREGKGDFVFDTRISYQVSESAKVAFLINNLLNREYMIRPLQIEAPRTFIMQVTVKL